MDADPPAAQGLRRPWSEVPGQVRATFESWWGRQVVAARSLAGGFSPGVAARLRAADGSGVFVKAASSEPNPDTPNFHRREIEVASRLPERTPAPRLLWWFDEGEPGWVLLAFEEIEGVNPATPWQPEGVARLLAALLRLEAALTPNPLPVGSVGSAGEALDRWVCGWRRLRDEGAAGPLDGWSARHLGALAALEGAAGAAAGGDTLLHFDLRADNMVLTPERVWFVDWPPAHVGAPWIDPLLLAPSVAMQGGAEPEVLLTQLPSYRAADSDAVTAVVAAVAGFLTHRALQPPPPGLPTLRAFQAAQGTVARRWLAERVGW